jgi:hypothetical protein
MKILEHQSIAEAYEAHVNAAKALREEVLRKYPVGSIIRCVLGRHMVTLEVTGVGCSWSPLYEPQMIHGINRNTGKCRKVSAINESAKIYTIRKP